MGRKNFLLGFFLIIFLIISLYIPNFVFAHPGNTSSDGCHFCRTNCEKWGWTYNTRHGHAGQACDPSKGPIDPLYTGSAPSTTPPTVAPTPIPTPPPPTPIPTPKPSPVAIPTPTPTPIITPTPSPTPTETFTPTPTPTTTPEVKGEATQPVQKRGFLWWLLTPLTTFLAIIFGWK